MYVVDVNDATFRGPPELEGLVTQHHRLHEGDRRIMSRLPTLAGTLGFEQLASYASVVSNTHDSEGAAVTSDQVALGHMTMWGLLSFIGQRPELADAFAEAQGRYIRDAPTISLEVQTQVYRVTGG